jgi:hypothetical protein
MAENLLRNGLVVICPEGRMPKQTAGANSAGVDVAFSFGVEVCLPNLTLAFLIVTRN